LHSFVYAGNRGLGRGGFVTLDRNLPAKVKERRLTQVMIAEMMGVTDRDAWRILEKVRVKGTKYCPLCLEFLEYGRDIASQSPLYIARFYINYKIHLAFQKITLVQIRFSKKPIFWTPKWINKKETVNLVLKTCKTCPNW
jgi:hypothetical protein